MTGNPLEEASTHLAAARNAADPEARALYAAQARRIVGDVAARTRVLELHLAAVEAELVRAASKAGVT